MSGRRKTSRSTLQLLPLAPATPPPRRPPEAPPGFPAYSSPREFLEALARRLRIPRERVRATDELLAYLESARSLGVKLDPAFVQTATRLISKQAELLTRPRHEHVRELAEHLERLNQGQPEARTWTRRDWRKLAVLVLKNRRLKTRLYFGDSVPEKLDIAREIEFPVCRPACRRPARRCQTPAARAALRITQGSRHTAQLRGHGPRRAQANARRP